MAHEMAGVKLCEKKANRSYDLETPAVKQIIEQRYGGIDKLPVEEPAVSPRDLAASTLLVEVPRLTKRH